MRFYLLLILIIFTLTTHKALAQQDMDLHVNSTFLSGKNILKVKRDFSDPYLWVLAENNEVYRINCLTFDVENYSSYFSSYNNFQFIDIAGINKDIFFIATSAANVVQYKSGVVKLLGISEGIAGNVNEVAIVGAYSNTGASYFPVDNLVIISTDNGLCRYNAQSETMLPGAKQLNSRIFESTYRTLALHAFDECYCVDQGDVKKYDFNTFWGSNGFKGEVFFGAEFGNNINAGFVTTGDPYNPPTGFSYYANHFWATEKGLFQNFFNNSYDYTRGYSHYLDNININKITSIKNLLNFGGIYTMGRSIVKENLLIGSSSGLYYSNSQYGIGQFASYSFNRYEGLGSIAINDICVNSNSYNYPLSDLPFFAQSLICEDGIWVASANGLYFLKPDYKPYINPDFRLQAIQVDGESFIFNIRELNICDDRIIKARAAYVQLENLNIQWFKDGQPLTTNPEITLDKTSVGDYHLLLEDKCTGIVIESYHLQVTSSAIPNLSFNYPDKINFCEGQTAVLEVNNQSTYKYRWYKNGVLYGNTTAVLNTTQMGKYKVEVSSCSGTWVSTKEVEVNFINTPQPNIASGKTNYCIDEVATLSTNFVNDGTFTIDWLLNGAVLTAYQNKTLITTTQSGTYTVRVSSNLVACSNTSIGYKLIFEVKPFVTLERIVTSTLCDGQSVDVKATYSWGKIKWSTGAATDIITVNRSGNYSATITSDAGCETSENINVTFFPNPTLSMADATLCQFIGETVTLSAPAGFAKYEWNGQPGSQSFSTNKLGPVNLKVTDNNGCTATQIINVTSKCDDIHVPNTFTPNNDGYNDTWNIAGIDDNMAITVRVFNRTGQMVFRSVGYKTSWDGTFNGTRLQAGTYFYIIDAKAATGQTLSGSVTIIN